LHQFGLAEEVRHDRPAVTWLPWSELKTAELAHFVLCLAVDHAEGEEIWRWARLADKVENPRHPVPPAERERASKLITDARDGWIAEILANGVLRTDDQTFRRFTGSLKHHVERLLLQPAEKGRQEQDDVTFDQAAAADKTVAAGAGTGDEPPTAATTTPPAPPSTPVPSAEATPRPPRAATAEGEQQKPDVPFVPLTSWGDIIAALNEPHGKGVWKNDDTTRNKIKKLNQEYAGPIVMPERQGGQPRVAKDALMNWWNSMSERFDNRTEETKQDAESAKVTTSNTHNYGATGTVVPGIGGHIKSSRKPK
jgi:hypothetical protein